MIFCERENPSSEKLRLPESSTEDFAANLRMFAAFVLTGSIKTILIETTQQTKFICMRWCRYYIIKKIVKNAYKHSWNSETFSLLSHETLNTCSKTLCPVHRVLFNNSCVILSLFIYKTAKNSGLLPAMSAKQYKQIALPISTTIICSISSSCFCRKERQNF